LEEKRGMKMRGEGLRARALSLSGVKSGFEASAVVNAEGGEVRVKYVEGNEYR